jgi:hypothetical protein
MQVYHFPVDAMYKKNRNEKGGSSSAVNAAMTVCDVFSWVQVVVMAFVWVALTSVQVSVPHLFSLVSHKIKGSFLLLTSINNFQLYFGLKHRVFFELKHKDYLEDTAQA